MMNLGFPGGYGVIPGIQQQLSAMCVRGKSYLWNLRTDPAPGEQARWVPDALGHPG